jgi:hypothetical protein
MCVWPYLVKGKLRTAERGSHVEAGNKRITMELSPRPRAVAAVRAVVAAIAATATTVIVATKAKKPTTA